MTLGFDAGKPVSSPIVLGGGQQIEHRRPQTSAGAGVALARRAQLLDKPKGSRRSYVGLDQRLFERSERGFVGFAPDDALQRTGEPLASAAQRAADNTHCRDSVLHTSQSRLGPLAEFRTRRQLDDAFEVLAGNTG